IALHLDHGDSFEICKDCVDGGFTSVMIDASHHDFDENVKITKQVVEYAHAHGVVVEAELGRLAGVEDDVNVSDADARFTDPEQAAEFVHLTGVDSLAIAIGTSHGAYKFKGDPYLDFDRLKKVGELLPDFPIVLHGASSVLPEFVAKCNEFGGNIPGAQGVPEEMLRKATDLRLAMTASVREYLAQNPSEFDPRKYLGPARDAIKGMVAHKIKNVLGSSNKL
ncbi:MAG: class II fructose-bisphosphate aldolase, partial [Veillonella sp.]|nr:class II fructose-bisphosphate aldolase [Veillonella sp.]